MKQKKNEEQRRTKKNEEERIFKNININISILIAPRVKGFHRVSVSRVGLVLAALLVDHASGVYGKLYRAGAANGLGFSNAGTVMPGPKGSLPSPPVLSVSENDA